MTDEGLDIIETMWRAGLAHRDIKPANVMVQDGHIRLIDVAFAQVRPSPWRQAVDLANMMLVLALQSSPELVYERAQLRFTDEELAEAFAASRGVTLPSGLRRSLRQDGRELLERFRELAPERRPVSIQRWSLRRVGLTLWVALVAFAVASMFISSLGDLGLRLVLPRSRIAVEPSALWAWPRCSFFSRARSSKRSPRRTVSPMDPASSWRSQFAPRARFRACSTSRPAGRSRRCRSTSTTAW
jgi:serine/threonine protein kinase